MPHEKLQKSMIAAGDPDFRARVQAALVRVATGSLTDPNPNLRSYAMKILNGTANVPAATIAVAAQVDVADAIEAGGGTPEAATEPGYHGVSDQLILDILTGGVDGADGLFGKLAAANQSG